MHKLKNIFKNKQYRIDLFIGLFLLLLPLSKALPNLILIPLTLLVILNYKKFRIEKSVPFLIFTLSVIVVIINISVNDFLIEEFNYVTKYLLVFISFILISQVKNIKQAEHFFLLGTSIAILGSGIELGIHTYQNPGFLLNTGAMVNELLWLERPYFGIVISLGVFICLKNAEVFKKNDYYILAVIFIAFSIYISARLSIVLNCILLFIFLLKSFRIQRGTKIWTGITIVLLIAIALGLSDNLISRMRISNDYDRTVLLIKDFEPRFVIWPCALEITERENHIAFGTGSFGKTENLLIDCYAGTIEKEDKRQYYIDRKFNTHNQFLDFLLVGGMFPAFLLLISFFVAWFSRIGWEQKLIFFIFFCFFLVENVLHRQLGCYLFGVFIALYSSRKIENV